jgi:hypothetical protein
MKPIRSGKWELVVIEDDKYRVKHGNILSDTMTYEELAYDYPFLASQLDQCTSRMT